MTTRQECLGTYIVPASVSGTGANAQTSTSSAINGFTVSTIDRAEFNDVLFLEICGGPTATTSAWNWICAPIFKSGETTWKWLFGCVGNLGEKVGSLDAAGTSI